MKRIRTGREGGEEAALREMAALRQIRREGIPVLADIWYEREAICLVMEYMTGVSLEETVREGGAMKEEDAVRLALQMAELVEFLHELPQKLIHGDLKPSNLLLCQGRAALLDFGGAVFQNSHRQDGGCYYTPGYAAPELEAGGGVSVASDIYAFGATLFFLVTGERPDSDRGIYPIREQYPTLSGRLEQIILACTKEEPQDRCASMGEVKRELQEVLLSFGRQGWSCGKRKRKPPENGAGHIFTAVRSVLLTEGKFRGYGRRIVRAMLLLFTGICMGLSAGPGAAHAAQILPVSIRNQAGERILVDYDAVYYTKENPMFELPLKYFEPGRKYIVTIRQEDQSEGLIRERSLMICSE